jgi:hypothetical protein
VDHLENERGLLRGLDAGEREQLSGLLRKLLLSSPFRELDPAANSPDAGSAAGGPLGR